MHVPCHPLRGEGQETPFDGELSPTTTPSRSSITRSATSSMAGSCVATMAVTPSLAHQAPEQAHDAVPGLRVELAGRLVGQQQGRLVGQRPCNGHPLLLAARQLVRPMVGPVRQAHQLEQLADPLLALRRLRSDQPQRHLDVLRGRQDRQQAEGLEDEADPARRKATSSASDSSDTVSPSTTTLPARRPVEGADQRQQRRLARSRAARGPRPARRARRAGRSPPTAWTTPPPIA